MLPAPAAFGWPAKNTCWPSTSHAPRCRPGRRAASAPGRRRDASGPGRPRPGRPRSVAAGLVVAELPGVEHVEGRQRPQRIRRYSAIPAPLGRCAGAAACSRSTPGRRRPAARGTGRRQRGCRRRGRSRRSCPRPRGRPRSTIHGSGGVRGLQVGVGPVLGVPLAVVGQRDGLAARVRARPRRSRRRVLVDVVAEVQRPGRGWSSAMWRYAV